MIDGDDLAREARSRDKERLIHEIIWLDRYCREQRQMIDDARARQGDLIDLYRDEGFPPHELEQAREEERPDRDHGEMPRGGESE